MTIKSITIQPAEQEDSTLPYPFHIQPDGKVGRQDFWRGKPLKLIGFNPKLQTGPMKGTVIFEKFWENPKLAIGKFPIMQHKNKKYYTYGIPIKSLRVNKNI